MPTIYRIEGSDGATPEGMDPVLAGQVTFDGKVSGRTMPGEYSALLLGCAIKPLPHPLESSSLRAQKETYLSASLKGILLRVERRICQGCGHIFDAPRIIFSGAAGCLPALLAAFTAFVVFRFTLGKSIEASFLIAWVVLMASCLILDLAGSLYVRFRFSERQARIAQQKCPVCGGHKSVSVASMAGKRVEIGEKGKWLKVSIGGRS